MVAIHQTAYPRLKKDLKPEELGEPALAIWAYSSN
jgi:hypothetical protein